MEEYFECNAVSDGEDGEPQAQSEHGATAPAPVASTSTSQTTNTNNLRQADTEDELDGEVDEFGSQRHPGDGHDEDHHADVTAEKPGEGPNGIGDIPHNKTYTIHTEKPDVDWEKVHFYDRNVAVEYHLALKSNPGLTAKQVAEKHRGVCPATLEAHLLALRRNLEVLELIDGETKQHGLRIHDEVLVNRTIDGNEVNIGTVRDVQLNNQISVKIRGESITLHSSEMEKIPPAYENTQTETGAQTDLYVKIPAPRRIMLHGEDFARFRNKIRGWKAWSALEDQRDHPPPRRTLLPPTMETSLLHSTPWRARRDSKGNFHPCSCCPDCTRQADYERMEAKAKKD